MLVLKTSCKVNMKIIQMLPSLAYGDAIGNDVLALRDALLSAGYTTEIFALAIDSRLPKGIAKLVKDYKDSEKNILIYHLAIGCELNQLLKNLKAKVVVIYHNITPPEFWQSYNSEVANVCSRGLKEVKELSDVPQLCFADSGFNKKDLINFGFKCPIEILPILIAFEDYKKEPNKKIIAGYDDSEFTNIIFTGRIAPNKKQEDIIAAFYYYKNYINPKSRLFFIGAYSNNDVYYNKLRTYVEELEIEDVYFTGHIKFEDILAYYRIADVFLCLSEHEGFCVPLVEAMYFRVPIIAFNSSAIGETLGESGFLLDEKDPRIVAEAIHRVMSDQELRDTIVENEKIRLRYFDNIKIKGLFLTYLREYFEL